MKHMMIQYKLKEDAAVDDVKKAIRGFIGHLRETSDGIKYSSYEKPDHARSFVHVGFFPDADVLKTVQGQPWFGEFAGFLKERCEEGPSVTWLSPVASTFLK